MRRFFFPTVSVLAGALYLGATGDLHAQPQQFQQKGVQIQQPRVTTAVMEEELESLEAQRETKKAYVKAAEIGVKAAELGQSRIEKLLASSVISKEDFDKAKLDVEAAKAQLEIRVAEMKEVDVKIKHLKKRIEMRVAPKEPVPPKDPPKPNAEDIRNIKT